MKGWERKMEFEGVKLDLPNGFEEEFTIIATLLSPIQSHIGILIVGEDYHELSKQPIIRIYLLALEATDWSIEDELYAFAFGDYASANRFVDELPNLSAIDFLLLINGHNQKQLQLFQ